MSSNHFYKRLTPNEYKELEQKLSALPHDTLKPLLSFLEKLQLAIYTDDPEHKGAKDNILVMDALKKALHYKSPKPK